MTRTVDASTRACVEHLDRGPLDRREIAAMIARDIPPAVRTSTSASGSPPWSLTSWTPPPRGSCCTPRTGCSGWVGRRSATQSIRI